MQSKELNVTQKEIKKFQKMFLISIHAISENILLLMYDEGSMTDHPEANFKEIIKLIKNEYIRK